MIEFKLAMRTEDGTRMFRAVVDGQVCIRPEWMFDPFQEAAPCWQVKRRPARGETVGPFHGARLESWWDGGQMCLGSKRNNRKQMK